MKSNATPSTSLGRALPQVDRMANRLRRCAAMARTAGHPWCATHADRQGPGVETAAAARVVRNPLLATVRTPFGSVRLAIDASQWPALASAARLPDDGRRHAVLTLLIEARLGTLAGLVTDFDLQVGSAGDIGFAGVTLQIEAVRCDVVSVDDRLLDALEAYVAELSPSLPAAMFHRSLPSRILLAARSLPAGRLRDLQVGDVLLLAAPNLLASGFEAWLSWGEGGPSELRTRVLLSGATMNLTSAPAVSGMPEDDVAGEVFLPGGRALLARLELPIGIELAGPLLRLADISGLKAGDVLELPVPIEQAQVRITVARQALGLGELVAIGGRLGVRILRMDAVPETVDAMAEVAP